MPAETTTPVEATIPAEAPTPGETTDSVEPEAATAAEMATAEIEQTATETVQPVQTEQPKEQKPAVSAQQKEWQKYDAMDQRVRLGAYGIVGVKETISAKEGETLGRISRRILGPDMECYVEVLNGMKAADVLKAGQKVKIPQLELKKRLKKQQKES